MEASRTKDEKHAKKSTRANSAVDTLSNKSGSEAGDGLVAAVVKQKNKIFNKVNKNKAKDVLPEKSILKEQYDHNIIDSDDSSDEEVLIRTGNVPSKWYDLYDH